MTQEEKKSQLKALEQQMSQADFWSDKETAQAVVKEFNDLKVS